MNKKEIDNPQDQYLPSKRELVYIKKNRGFKDEKLALQKDFIPVLPKYIYAVVDLELPLYFENLVAVKESKKLDFEFKCKIGLKKTDHYLLNPAKEDIGKHKLVVIVKNKSGKVLGTSQCELIVSPKDSGKDQNVKILVLGASVTNNGRQLEELARLLDSQGNPEWKMLGTRKPAYTKNPYPGVYHEGQGGFTWKAFLSWCFFDDNGKVVSKSPFVFLNSKNETNFDPARYVREQLKGETPDLIINMMGINDNFWCSSKNYKDIEENVNAMSKHADELMASLRKIWPKVEFAICTLPSVNIRDKAFEKNYAKQNPAGWEVGLLHRWNWKLVQHHVLKMQIKNWSNSAKEGLSLVPVYYAMDPEKGYPDNNAVHPNALGLDQMGQSLYCWLKYWLAEH
jgi:lysophospholipase L1-like esterase